MAMFDSLFGGMQDPEKWRRFFGDLQQSGIKIDPTQTGGPAYRAYPSRHPGGGAVDLNYNDQPVGFRYNLQPQDPNRVNLDRLAPEAEPHLQTQIPSELAEALAAKHGLTWGGNFKRLNTGQAGPDPHHFEDPRVPLRVGAPLSPSGSGSIAGAPVTPEDYEARRQRLYQREPQSQGPSLATMALGPTAGGWVNNLWRNNPGFVTSLFEIGRRGEIGAGISKAYADERQAEFSRAAKAEDIEIDWRKYGLSKAQEDRTAADWNRVEKTRAERRAIWDAAVADPSHQLWKGLTPEEKEAAIGLGADEGFELISKMRFATAGQRAKAQQELELQKQRLDEWERRQGAQPAAGSNMPPAGSVLGGGGQPAIGPTGDPMLGGGVSPPPALAPSIAAPGAPAAGFGGGGGLSITGPAEAVAGGLPQMPGFGGPDAGTRAAIGANILLGKEAADAVEKEASQRRAAALAGPQKYLETEATERAKHRVGEEKKVQGAIEMFGHIADLERAANALGRTRLHAAASPSLDTWTGRNIFRLGSDQAWNDRQLLLGNINQMIVQARETQRGLGPLTEGEQAVLESAYAGMKNATSAEAFYMHLDTLRGILGRKIPGMKVEPKWITDAEKAQKAVREQTKAGQEQEKGKPMTPPRQTEGSFQADKLTSDMEGARAYDHEKGVHGTIINGKLVPDKTQDEELREIARQKFQRRRKREQQPYYNPSYTGEF